MHVTLGLSYLGEALELQSFFMTKSLAQSQVLKIPFEGTLSKRFLYVYLPPGYDESNEHYPVLYMHDGQNCFESYLQDSFAGSWHADTVADTLISQKLLRPFIIVGVSNGQTERLAEYLPPYISFSLPRPKGVFKKMPEILGHADRTFTYYLEVQSFLKQHFRVLEGRDNTATCGSSMGGLFSTYIAWEHPEFAKYHAALSPAYWMTNDGQGHLLTIERIKTSPIRDVRLWLDSGEGTSNIPGQDDDNKFVTMEAREALQEAGYKEGKDFVYHLAKGGLHNEAAWAARLDKVFTFLMGSGFKV
jgi:predicted alpha/beta superfamily hydrolase